MEITAEQARTLVRTHKDSPQVQACIKDIHKHLSESVTEKASKGFRTVDFNTMSVMNATTSCIEHTNKFAFGIFDNNFLNVLDPRKLEPFGSLPTQSYIHDTVKNSLDEAKYNVTGQGWNMSVEW